MKHHRPVEMMRKVAVIAAVLLLVGQTIAAAHFHSVSSQQEFAASTAGIADSSCAICAAQLHSPAASAVAPALDAPSALESLLAPAVFGGPLTSYAGDRFGRAPPVPA